MTEQIPSTLLLTAALFYALLHEHSGGELVALHSIELHSLGHVLRYEVLLQKNVLAQDLLSTLT